MSWPRAPFQVTSSFGKGWSSSTCGFVSVRRFAVACPSDCTHTSRGVTESSRRNTSVAPFASIEGRPSSAGPLVRAVSWPSSVVR